jgi:hypothetical protein
MLFILEGSENMNPIFCKSKKKRKKDIFSVCVEEDFFLPSFFPLSCFRLKHLKFSQVPSMGF